MPNSSRGRTHRISLTPQRSRNIAHCALIPPLPSWPVEGQPLESALWPNSVPTQSGAKQRITYLFDVKLFRCNDLRA
jgi:hypothetical protein